MMKFSDRSSLHQNFMIGGFRVRENEKKNCFLNCEFGANEKV